MGLRGVQPLRSRAPAHVRALTRRQRDVHSHALGQLTKDSQPDVPLASARSHVIRRGWILLSRARVPTEFRVRLAPGAVSDAVHTRCAWTIDYVLLAPLLLPKAVPDTAEGTWAVWPHAKLGSCATIVIFQPVAALVACELAHGGITLPPATSTKGQCLQALQR